MGALEQSFDNKNVLSLGDRVVLVFGSRNPNDEQFKGNKGIIFVEQPAQEGEQAVLWIKRSNQDNQSWETWENVVTNSVVVGPGNTEEVDKFALADFTTSQWLMDLDDGTSKKQSFEMLGQAKGTAVDYTRFAILGDKIDFDILLSSDGTEMKLEMKNNESNAITIKYRRRAI